MTEYTTSPQAIQVYKSSRERTEYWVRSHSPFHSQFNSPESPPSVTGDVEFEDVASDDGSSHSLPPKMMLKYGDGRDIPISHWHYDNPGTHNGSSHGSSSHHYPHGRSHPPHDRSWSAGDAYPTRQQRHSEYAGYRQPARDAYEDAPEDLEPEEIRILPADPHATPHDTRNDRYRPRRTSEPYRRDPPPPAPYKTTTEILETPLPSYIPNHAPAPAPPPVTYSHSQPIPHQYEQHHPAHSHSRHRPPPSIVYAPGSNHSSDHYAPPTIVYAPTKAPGMTYTVSAPTGSGFPQYPRITPAPYPTVHSHLASIHEEPRYGSRAPSTRERTSRAPSPISEVDSGSTYYVIPTPGQKVKVLPAPAPSLYTATSTTKTSSSTHPSSRGFRKPFFSRLFSFASDLSKASKLRKQAPEPKLQRRHSLDAHTNHHTRRRL